MILEAIINAASMIVIVLAVLYIVGGVKWLYEKVRQWM